MPPSVPHLTSSAQQKILDHETLNTQKKRKTNGWYQRPTKVHMFFNHTTPTNEPSQKKLAIRELASVLSNNSKLSDGNAPKTRVPSILTSLKDSESSVDAG